MRSEKLDFLQINYSLMEREAEEHILPLAQDRQVAVIINRPFGGGDLFSRVRSRPLPDWAAEFDCRSWSQFFLKWIRRATGSDLRHSRDRQAAPSRRQHAGRSRPSARGKDASANGGVYSGFVGAASRHPTS